jgi:hypothetical protein
VALRQDETLRLSISCEERRMEKFKGLLFGAKQRQMPDSDLIRSVDSPSDLRNPMVLRDLSKLLDDCG